MIDIPEYFRVAHALCQACDPVTNWLQQLSTAHPAITEAVRLGAAAGPWGWAMLPKQRKKRIRSFATRFLTRVRRRYRR